jgi:hypothetical protein
MYVVRSTALPTVISWWVLAALALTLCGCMGEALDEWPSPPGTGGGAEVSPVPDAGTPKALPDAGLENPGMDAGSSHDGGRPDAGGHDAGQGTPTPDSGSPRDAGITNDAGTARDGGCPGTFCDGFETGVGGHAPPAPWSVDLSRTQDGQVVIDSAMNHSGGQSLKLSVVANPGNANAVWAFATLSGAPALPLATMYGRMWVRFDQLASNNGNYLHVNNVQASGLLSNHTTTATYTYGMYYYQGTNIQTGYTTDGSNPKDDATSANPYVTPSLNTWLCYEWMLAPPHASTFWLNGTQVPGLNIDNSNWPTPVAFDTLQIGWAQWWNSTVPTTMWVDDFAIGTTRLGCQ